MKTILIILIALISMSSSCKKNSECTEGTHETLEIINNSDIIINWRPSNPDSVYHINGAPANNILNTNSSYFYGPRQSCWEVLLKKEYPPLYILIFNNDTVQSIGWDVISGTNRGLLKRVKLDIDSLEEHDFKITYP